MEREFEGKTVIVTGSSSGIGEGIAILFANGGANVTLCGRDTERLEAAREKCRQASGEDGINEFIAVCGDVTETETQESIVKDTIEKFGRLDVLVCNHGVYGKNICFNEVTEETYDNVMNTNLKSVFFLIQYAIPHLEKTKGNIINISSLASTWPQTNTMQYGISKAGLDHLTRSLALDLAPKGIRVNAVAPTVVLTRVFRDMSKEETEHVEETIGSVHPLGGRASTVAEQAEAVLFLASERASFITGQCLKVDGGMSLRCSSK